MAYLDRYEKWFRRNRVKNMVWNTAETEVSVSVVDKTNASHTDTKNVSLTSEEVLKEAGFPDHVIENVSLYTAAHEGAHVRYSDIKAIEQYMRKMKSAGKNMEIAEALAQIAEDYRVDARITKDKPGYNDLRKRSAAGVVEFFSERPSGDESFDEMKALSCLTYGYDLRAFSEWRNAVDWDLVEKAARYIMNRIDEYLSKGESTSFDAMKVAEETYKMFYDTTTEPKGDDSGPKGDDSGSTSGETEASSGKGSEDDADTSAAAERILGSLPKVFGEKERHALDQARWGLQVREAKREDLRERVKEAEEFVLRGLPKSLWTPAEREEYIRELCRGAHAGMTLHYCEAMDRSYPAKITSQMITEAKALTNQIRDMLRAAKDDDAYVARHGKLDTRRAWRAATVGRSDIFRKAEYIEEGGYVVDILLDASGSQSRREEAVAQSSWIISTAIVNAGIPCRVTMFDNRENITLIQRLRDYDDPAKACDRCLHFRAGMDNRDGLAILTVGKGLLKRPETKKILIVLSDGAPYDMQGEDAAAAYGGVKDYIIHSKEIRSKEVPEKRIVLDLEKSPGVRDTANVVRELRKKGIALLGVYIGSNRQNTLEAERYMYGNDFAHIQDMKGFSRTVARYLQKQILKFRED